MYFISLCNYFILQLFYLSLKYRITHSLKPINLVLSLGIMLGFTLFFALTPVMANFFHNEDTSNKTQDAEIETAQINYMLNLQIQYTPLLIQVVVCELYFSVIVCAVSVMYIFCVQHCCGLFAALR